MKNENHIILIPWDFTPVAEFALLHGFKFAEKAKSGAFQAEDKARKKAREKAELEARTKKQQEADDAWEAENMFPQPEETERD